MDCLPRLVFRRRRRRLRIFSDWDRLLACISEPLSKLCPMGWGILITDPPPRFPNSARARMLANPPVHTLFFFHEVVTSMVRVLFGKYCQQQSTVCAYSGNRISASSYHENVMRLCCLSHRRDTGTVVALQCSSQARGGSFLRQHVAFYSPASLFLILIPWSLTTGLPHRNYSAPGHIFKFSRVCFIAYILL